MRVRSYAGPITFVLVFALLCGGYAAIRSVLADSGRAVLYSAPPPLKGWAYSLYDNGAEQRLTAYAIENLIATATADERLKLGSGWEQSPGYAARYFTMNLVGIADQRADAWTQTLSGPGNAIAASDGTSLGVYAGSFNQDRTSNEAAVTLQTAGRKAYLIGLSRPWPGGPWLVTRVEETEHVSLP